jgi:hypothetical protein
MLVVVPLVLTVVADTLTVDWTALGPPRPGTSVPVPVATFPVSGADSELTVCPGPPPGLLLLLHADTAPASNEMRSRGLRMISIPPPAPSAIRVPRRDFPDIPRSR